MGNASLNYSDALFRLCQRSLYPLRTIQIWSPLGSSLLVTNERAFLTVGILESYFHCIWSKYPCPKCVQSKKKNTIKKKNKNAMKNYLWLLQRHLRRLWNDRQTTCIHQITMTTTNRRFWQNRHCNGLRDHWKLFWIPINQYSATCGPTLPVASYKVT